MDFVCENEKKKKKYKPWGKNVIYLIMFISKISV